MEEALAQHEEQPVSNTEDEAQGSSDNDQTSGTPRKIDRPIPIEKQDPAVRFRDAKAESERYGEWGSGEGGYKSPKSASEKMRFVVASFRLFTLITDMHHF